jgi:hypothetical protein
VRKKYKNEALAGFVHMSAIFKAVGGAPEILDPHKPALPVSKRYRIPLHFMGSLAGYAGIYRKLKRLGWL